MFEIFENYSFKLLLAISQYSVNLIVSNSNYDCSEIVPKRIEQLYDACVIQTYHNIGAYLFYIKRHCFVHKNMMSSKHLSPREFQQLSDILGPRKESLSTTIVQLLFATTTRPFTWQVKITGVACFVKDSDRKAFFIEVRKN